MLQNEKILKKEFIPPCNNNCSYCFLNYTDTLGGNNLFENISPDEIGHIIRNIHHQVKSYRKGELIAQSGDEYNNLFIIVQGKVVGEIIDFEGKILQIEELKAADTTATAFIFGKNNQLPVNITALEDTRLLIIPRHDLVQLFKSNEIVLQNYLNIMANRAQHLSRKIRMLAMQTIRAKLANYLLEELKENDNSEIVLKHSQNELSEIFGVARPSLSRVIRDLHNEGILYARSKKIRIINSAALSAFLKR